MHSKKRRLTSKPVKPKSSRLIPKSIPIHSDYSHLDKMHEEFGLTAAQKEKDKERWKRIKRGFQEVDYEKLIKINDPIVKAHVKVVLTSRILKRRLSAMEKLGSFVFDNRRSKNEKIRQDIEKVFDVLKNQTRDKNPSIAFLALDILVYLRRVPENLEELFDHKDPHIRLKAFECASIFVQPDFVKRFSRELSKLKVSNNLDSQIISNIVSYLRNVAAFGIEGSKESYNVVVKELRKNLDNKKGLAILKGLKSERQIVKDLTWTVGQFQSVLEEVFFQTRNRDCKDMSIRCLAMFPSGQDFLLGLLPEQSKYNRSFIVASMRFYGTHFKLNKLYELLEQEHSEIVREEIHKTIEEIKKREKE